MKEKLKLYLVTDSDILKERDFYKCIEDALKGGVTTLQLREKNVNGKEFLEKAYKLRELTKKYNVLFIINDRVDIAMLCDADGVHVGQHDMEVGEVRQMLGKEKIIGVSARTVEQAQRAQLRGADYLGVGAVFHTGTKEDAKKLDRRVLKSITEAVDIPVIGIGGIQESNVLELSGNGLCGVAVVSAVFAQADIEEAARKLKILTEKMIKQEISDL